MLTSYPVALHIGMKRLYGHFFPAAGRIYFVCEKQGGVWGAAIGQAVGGAIGGAISALSTHTPGQAPPTVDEHTVQQVMAQREGSFVLEAKDISMIKHTLMWRLLKWQGKTVGFPQGLSKELKAELGRWAKYHNVQTKGL